MGGINKLSKLIGCELFREELESILGYAQEVEISMDGRGRALDNAFRAIVVDGVAQERIVK